MSTPFNYDFWLADFRTTVADAMTQWRGSQPESAHPYPNFISPIRGRIFPVLRELRLHGPTAARDIRSATYDAYPKLYPSQVYSLGGLDPAEKILALAQLISLPDWSRTPEKGDVLQRFARLLDDRTRTRFTALYAGHLAEEAIWGDALIGAGFTVNFSTAEVDHLDAGPFDLDLVTSRGDQLKELMPQLPGSLRALLLSHPTSYVYFDEEGPETNFWLSLLVA